MLKEFDKYCTDSKCQSRNLPQVPLIQIVLFCSLCSNTFLVEKSFDGISYFNVY